ncbi:hypothetical protein PTTG_04466 [Puccinia triticina 1-1 BBBD Race 1]|uniref:Prolyl 4-hydroxylase alpha subunit Fe(2+) 2OG dioxygenase domain-containing protein n=2 Tax=Puccinia triticina TaxID=208348 RepID=A0A0C4DF40_PUCT1|nr:uncharacterized protein PtA15_18A427 [Puccinia triticina]OAV92072.1 hypothetical protein PTTG_04466 [Puccinia triticina 1-1 BBBD Race 1]WAQ93367.1 hypothetical protein PtA15_18A427 [Puccinia triticina]
MSDKRMHDPAEGHEKTKENLSDTSDTIVVDDIADSDDPDTLHEDSSDEMDEDSIEDSEDDMDDDSEDDSDHEISLPDDLNKALKAIKTPGTFAAWEVLLGALPAGLHVDGVGDISMPLSEECVRKLIAKAHQAPFGRRSETLVDVSVRNTWEIDGDQLRFLDPLWLPYLVDLNKRVAKSLAHTGGEVVVKHNGETKTLSTSDAKQSFACWFSDVTHEVLPVKSGYRCVLTYNLATRPDEARPSASTFDLEKVPLRQTLRRWSKDARLYDAESFLYYPLEHEYTQASMSLQALKAEDYARVKAVQDLTAELPFEIFLALMEKKEQGMCEPDGTDDYKRCGGYDGEIEVDETGGSHVLEDVDDTEYVVKSLHALDGKAIASDFDFDTDQCTEDDPFAFVGIAREE